MLWDTHPLALSATPIQVYIDGIPQLSIVASVDERLGAKPGSFQAAPKVPNFDEEVRETLKWEGLPPLLPKEWEVKDVSKMGEEVKNEGGRRIRGDVVFVRVGKVYLREEVDGDVQVKQAFVSSGARAKEQGKTSVSGKELHGVAVVRSGKLVCYGIPASCNSFIQSSNSASRPVLVDLKGGAISPGFISFGAPLGLQEIEQEPSTGDGEVLDPLVKEVSNLVKGGVVRAADGLQFATRDALYVHLSVFFSVMLLIRRRF